MTQTKKKRKSGAELLQASKLTAAATKTLQNTKENPHCSLSHKAKQDDGKRDREKKRDTGRERDRDRKKERKKERKRERKTAPPAYE